MHSLKEIPTTDAMMENPSLAMELPPDDARTVLTGLAGLIPLLIARAAQQAPPQADTVTAPSRWLTVKEVGTMFGLTPRWLYAHKHVLPYSQPSHKTLLFDEQKLRRWLESHKGG